MCQTLIYALKTQLPYELFLLYYFLPYHTAEFPSIDIKLKGKFCVKHYAKI